MSRKLKTERSNNRVLLYTFLILFFSSIITAALAFYPLYTSSKQNIENKYNTALQVESVVISNHFEGFSNIAKQITSRTKASNLLIALNDKINTKDQASLKKILTAALNSSDTLIGIQRYNRKNQLVATVGQNLNHAHHQFTSQFFKEMIHHNGKIYLETIYPIFSQTKNKTWIGNDIAYFTMGRVIQQLHNSFTNKRTYFTWHVKVGTDWQLITSNAPFAQRKAIQQNINDYNFYKKIFNDDQMKLTIITPKDVVFQEALTLLTPVFIIIIIWFLFSAIMLGLLLRPITKKLFRYAEKLEQSVVNLKSMQQKLRSQALHDEVTNLPNRRSFQNELKRTLEKSYRSRQDCCVLYIDLDDFKKINDTWGHDLGDKFLIETSKALRKSIKSYDFLARIGGDEFAIILEQTNVSKAKKAAGRLLKLFNKPIHIGMRSITPTCSIGLASNLYPNQQTATEILKKADMAMYQAKSAGKNTIQFYSKELNAKQLERNRLEERLKTFLKEPKNLFTIELQPVLNLKTEKICGFEILSRWDITSDKRLEPKDFIPIAEEINLIEEVGKRVIISSFKLIHQWKQNYPELFKRKPPVFHINCSVKQLISKKFHKDLASLMQKYEIKPSYIGIEITESVLISNQSQAEWGLKELNKMGISLAIDDFGTGYSSLEYLQRLPFDTLKIDQSFIAKANKNADSRAILKTIVQLAQNLNMKTIAEGVETKSHLNLLKKTQCKMYQGFYTSRPLSPDDCITLLKKSGLIKKNLK